MKIINNFFKLFLPNFCHSILGGCGSGSIDVDTGTTGNDGDDCPFEVTEVSSTSSYNVIPNYRVPIDYTFVTSMTIDLTEGTYIAMYTGTQRHDDGGDPVGSVSYILQLTPTVLTGDIHIESSSRILTTNPNERRIATIITETFTIDSYGATIKLMAACTAHITNINITDRVLQVFKVAE